MVKKGLKTPFGPLYDPKMTQNGPFDPPKGVQTVQNDPFIGFDPLKGVKTPSFLQA